MCCAIKIVPRFFHLFSYNCYHKQCCSYSTAFKNFFLWQVLIEILASRTNEQIKAIREVYKKEYKSELEKAVSGDTSGDFKRLLIALTNVSVKISYTTCFSNHCRLIGSKSQCIYFLAFSLILSLCILSLPYHLYCHLSLRKTKTSNCTTQRQS